MTITVVYSQPTKRAQATEFVETDLDTITSAKEIADSLTRNGWSTSLIGLEEDRYETRIRAIHADMIFNMIDWTGPDIALSLRAIDLIDASGIPYVGASKKTYTLCANKVSMKESLVAADIPTPWWQSFTTGSEPVCDHIPFPVIVKLADEHCSVGIDRTSIVVSDTDLRAEVKKRIAQFGRTVFAEQFVGGREFQVALVERDGLPDVLPPAEILYRVTGTDAILTFKSRWEENDPDFHSSYIRQAVLEPALWDQMQTICRKTWDALGFTDYTRIDMRMGGDTLYVLEANANPGLGDDDLTGITIAYKAVGWTFDEYIRAIVQSCARRYHLTLPE